MDRIVWKYTDPFSGTEKQFSLDTDNVPTRLECSITPLMGKSGFLLPPISLISDKVPRRAGNVLRERVVGARKVDIPIRLEAPNYTQLIELQRHIANILNVDEGKLVFSFAGKQRELRRVTYTDGMIGEDKDTEQFIVWANMMLSFEAHDPYFYDVDEYQEEERYLDTSVFVEFLDDNFLDSMLSPNGVGGTWEVKNAGADTAWAVWYLTGPISSGFSIGIVDGPSFTLNYTISEGEVVTVDTRPGEKTVTSSISGDLFTSLTNTSTLWGFPRGVSTVELSVSGINAASKVKYRLNIPYGTM